MNRAIFPLLLMLFAILAPASNADSIRPSDRFVAGEEPGSVERLPARLAEFRPSDKSIQSVATVCPDSFDVIHYNLFINIKTPTTTLECEATIRFSATKANLTGVRLDLRQLSVSAIERSGTPLIWSHVGETLLVTLDAPLPLGDTTEIKITYSGIPDAEGPGGFGGFWFHPAPITDFSMGVGLNTEPPSMGRYWFPGVDSPCDKATSEVHLKVPSAKFGVSNGRLISVTPDSTSPRMIYNWQNDHPISTYLMAMSVAKYQVVADTVNPMITYYVHDTAPALGTFQNVHHMMDTFESLFGAYPYDTFSFVTTPLGDMEHQTCVFHSTALMTGDTSYDDILSHELTHQWFGNLVTYGDWRDVWLSEGFATYGEALFREDYYSVNNYHNYVNNQLMPAYLNAAGSLTWPIYDPVSKWGPTSYEKGATVLHMLRHVMGDGPFFAALNDYLDNHRYGNAVTSDFQADCEGQYGGSLAWFFNEWIFSGGHPIFDWGWEALDLGGSWEVSIQTVQTQTIGPVYTMPVDFLISWAGGDTTVVAEVNALSQTFVFTVPFEPTGLLFDPDNWLLDEANEIATGTPAGVIPPWITLGPNRPNPFNPATIIPFRLPGNSPVTLEIFNTGGRLVRSLLMNEPRAAGDHSIRWDGLDGERNQASSGVYFYRLLSREGTETRKMQLIR